ncbi:hypothetical protein EON65_10480 [archaeon]|nr:MAG: hypothetical protein EON65_10480 [archaeon]
MSDHGSLSDSLNPDAHSAVHSHQQVKPSESSNALSGGISKRLLDFKVTMAYEKSLTKEKCNLCQLYFNRNSICYKVPNHRIYSLRREWSKTKNGFDKQGRRYESASFLYQSTTVCCFCSQFFTQLPDEVPGDPNRDGGYKILNPKDTGAKLTVGTEVSRQNVALARHVYQSSNVDNKLAELAITPPYSQTSKTRREVDPWWEIDFGRYYHVHSISFDVNVGARQAWEVYVMLLDKPVGFNDPFLDHMGSFSKLHKQFNLDAQDKARTESIYWEQPEHSTCYAIRVQLRGIHALSLSRVIVLQGDDIMLSKPEDFELSTQSLASLDPFIVKTSIQESLSPGKRFELMEAHHNPMTEHHAYDKRTCVDAVQKLSLHIQSRYENLEKWRALVLEHSQIFPDSEILMLHRIVFKYASDLFPHNKGRPLSEHELMTSGLIAHYPRCDLMEVHQRVRSVIRWIQTRTHMKVLGALLDSVPLNAIANAPSDQLYHLMSAFKRAEYYWNKRDQQELLHGSLNGSTRASQVVHSTMDEIRGCSWSQFLLIMGLFCKQQCELIPEKVFHIEHSHAMRRQSEVMPEELYSLNGSADGRSVSSYSLSTIMPQKSLQQQQQRKIQTAIDRSRSRGNLRHALGSDAPNGSTLNAPSVLSSSTSLLSSTFKTINDKKQTKSILDTVRYTISILS